MVVAVDVGRSKRLEALASWCLGVVQPGIKSRVTQAADYTTLRTTQEGRREELTGGATF